MSDDVRAREKLSSNERCAICHDEFGTTPAPLGGERVTCGDCNTSHHAECFAENGGCAALGCVRTRPMSFDVIDPEPGDGTRGSLPIWIIIVAIAVLWLAFAVNSMGVFIVGCILMIVGALAFALGRFLDYADRPVAANVDRSESPAQCPWCSKRIVRVDSTSCCEHCGAAVT